MNKYFNNIYQNKKVLLTGHTGFKGSWMALWLKQLGAQVIGYSLSAPSQPNHLDLLKLDIVSVIDDIRNRDRLNAVFAEHQPDIVFHLAAQPLVRYSYVNPHETFETNVMGTINVLEAAKKTPSVKAIINITSDKCYENKEWVWGYREKDPMGGYDPYSASKGCSELVTSSYQNSFFNIANYGKTHRTLLASVRAGNVIGGGDWAEDRLIPDIIRAVSENKIVSIRNPQATRPWQHVLDPLSGYLLVGQKLLEGRTEFAQAWNFGPSDEGALTVGQVVERVKRCWDKIQYQISEDKNHPHEANYLKLDCSKAHIKLNWSSLWDSTTAIAKAVEWYRKYYIEKAVVSRDDLAAYLQSGKNENKVWA